MKLVKDVWDSNTVLKNVVLKVQGKRKEGY